MHILSTQPATQMDSIRKKGKEEKEEEEEEEEEEERSSMYS